MTSLLQIHPTAYLKLGITAGPQPSWLRYRQYFVTVLVSGGYTLRNQWAAHSSNFSQARTFWRMVLWPPASKTIAFNFSCSALETPGIQEVSLILAASPAFWAICLKRAAHLAFSICSSFCREVTSTLDPVGAGLFAGSTGTSPPIVIASPPPWSGGPNFALPNDIPNPRSVAISPSIRDLDFSIRWASMVNRSSRFSRRSFAFWSSWAALTRPAIFESTAIDLSSTTANQNSTWSKRTSLRALTNSSSNKGRERILLSDLSILEILRQKYSTDHWDSEAGHRPSVKSRSRDLGSWPDRRLDRQHWKLKTIANWMLTSSIAWSKNEKKRSINVPC